MDRIRLAAHALSVFFSGVVGIGVFLVLALLGVIGTILTATDVLNINLDPGLLFLPAAIIVAGNLVYREGQSRKQAESERDAAKAALDAKPDEAAILRLFLRLHDFGPTVSQPFHETIEQLPKTMQDGEKLYAEWIALCTNAIEEHRPSFALTFRQAQAINYAAYRGMYVIVKDAEDRNVYVDVENVRKYDDLIAQAMKVRADIIKAG